MTTIQELAVDVFSEGVEYSLTHGYTYVEQSPDDTRLYRLSDYEMALLNDIASELWTDRYYYGEWSLCED